MPKLAAIVTIFVLIAGCGSSPRGEPDGSVGGDAGDADASGIDAVDASIEPGDCLDGAITDPCLCGGTLQTSGYCCSGAHQADDCAPPSCAEGAISSVCLCGAVAVSEGYCCAEVPQNIVCNVSGATYFVSESGSDTNSGLNANQPWRTLSKVNETTFEAGDQILFGKGDTFFGTLEINDSGEAATPIMYGSYGDGAKPVFTGFTELSGWTSQGGGLYSASVVSESQTNMVTIDGVSTGMGRTPNATYLSFESANANISITDVGLGDSPNWAGAELVVRKNNWTMNRYPIEDHTGDTLTYSASGTGQAAKPDFGYFIQNDLRTLDAFGEWYHDLANEQFYMFFGGEAPTSRTVKIATVDHLLVSHNNAYHVVVDGLAFEGSIDHGLDFQGYKSEWVQVRNCDIAFAGQHGIHLEGCTNFTITGNTIRHSASGGVHASNCGGEIITDNTLSELGLIPGAAAKGMNAEGIFYRVVELAWAPQQALIEGNRIESTGYAGIYFSGDNVEVRNNVTNQTCLVLDDCGGIYTGGHGPVGRIIEGNIVRNSIGNTDGAPGTSAMSEGIYLDENASEVLVRDNTVAHCSNSGIKLHKAHSNTIDDNTLYDNKQGIGFENWENTPNIHSNVITGNIFFAKEPAQLAWRMYSVVNDTASFGTSDNNVFARPMDDTDIFLTSQPSTGVVMRTLEGWRSFSGQDASSQKAPLTIANVTELQFEYNATDSAVTVVLSQSMVDAWGTSYQGSLVLQPYSSVILLREQTP